jgi:hypothetical protein
MSKIAQPFADVKNIAIILPKFFTKEFSTKAKKILKNSK